MQVKMRTSVVDYSSSEIITKQTLFVLCLILLNYLPATEIVGHFYFFRVYFEFLF